LTNFGNYIAQPFYNDLSDHDTQSIKINDITLQYQHNDKYNIRKSDKGSLTDFITRLRYEAWGSIFCNYDADAIFTSFFNT
jgi:hypothetical protein